MEQGKTQANLQVSHLAWPVTALGPGARAALWLAGCPLACPGCITPELQDETAGYLLTVDDVYHRLLKLPCSLSGITLTGGEPFAQTEGLADLCQKLKVKRPQWNILLFTGYQLTYLKRLGDQETRLLAQLDLLVDGPYMENKPSPEPLLASCNQQLHALSPRGEGLLTTCATLQKEQGNIGISNGGDDCLIGIIGPEQRRLAHQKMNLTKEQGKE